MHGVLGSATSAKRRVKQRVLVSKPDGNGSLRLQLLVACRRRVSLEMLGGHATLPASRPRHIYMRTHSGEILYTVLVWDKSILQS
jgi:hypothetical protein